MRKLIDSIDFGLPESEERRRPLGDLLREQDTPRTDFAGRDFLAEQGPTVHLRDSARWSAVELHLPRDREAGRLVFEITTKTYRSGLDEGRVGPTYFYLISDDRSRLIGQAIIPDDDRWHIYRFESDGLNSDGRPLYFVIDDLAGFQDQDNHFGHSFGTLGIYAQGDLETAEPSGEDQAKTTIPTGNSDVVLINCPVWDHLMPPIGLGTISSFLRANSIPVHIVDFNIEAYRNAPEDKRLIWHGANAPLWNEQPFVSMALKHLEPGLQQAADRIAGIKPAYACFSLATVNKPVTLRLAHLVKKKLPNTKIVFGGPGIPFFEPDQFGDDWDYLVLGAGEYALLHIVKNKPGRIQGVLSREDAKNKELFSDQAKVLDINRMPPLDFIGFDLSVYTSPWRIPMLTSRGCINQCKYCFDHVYYGPFSALTGENAYNQLVRMHELHGRRQFEFSDLLCNGDLDHLADMCKRIVDGGHDFIWGSFAVIRTDMPAELLKLMKQAGCRYLHYGFESGSEKMLRLMGRDYTPEQARKVLADTHHAGIRTHINLMVGFPGETDQTIEETIDFIRNYSSIIDLVDTVNPVYLMALSELHDDRDSYGIQLHEEVPDTWETKDLDQQKRESWVLRVIDGVKATGVKSNLGISRSFQCRFYD